jgi:hypothetical protein
MIAGDARASRKNFRKHCAGKADADTDSDPDPD